MTSLSVDVVLLMSQIESSTKLDTDVSNGDNELMAVAKLSEPLKKTPNNEITLKVRLDY